jgi:hypothetical protein
MAETEGVISREALLALGLPEDEVDTLLQSAQEKAALCALGIGEDQYKGLEVYRRAKYQYNMDLEKEKAKRAREMGNKVQLPKAGPARLNHWETLTYIQHVDQWRAVPEHLEAIDDAFFLSIIMNQLTGDPHQLITGVSACTYNKWKVEHPHGRS